MVTSDHGLEHLISFSAGQQLVRAITQVWVPDLARLIQVIGSSQVLLWIFPIILVIHYYY